MKCVCFVSEGGSVTFVSRDIPEVVSDWVPGSWRDSEHVGWSFIIQVGLRKAGKVLVAPNLKGLGAYNLGSVRPSGHPYVRPYVLPWTAISRKCMDQIV